MKTLNAANQIAEKYQRYDRLFDVAQENGIGVRASILRSTEHPKIRLSAEVFELLASVDSSPVAD